MSVASRASTCGSHMHAHTHAPRAPVTRAQVHAARLRPTMVGATPRTHAHVAAREGVHMCFKQPSASDGDDERVLMFVADGPNANQSLDVPAPRTARRGEEVSQPAPLDAQRHAGRGRGGAHARMARVAPHESPMSPSRTPSPQPPPRMAQDETEDGNGAATNGVAKQDGTIVPTKPHGDVLATAAPAVQALVAERDATIKATKRELMEAEMVIRQRDAELVALRVDYDAAQADRKRLAADLNTTKGELAVAKGELGGVLEGMKCLQQSMDSLESAMAELDLSMSMSSMDDTDLLRTSVDALPSDGLQRGAELLARVSVDDILFDEDESDADLCAAVDEEVEAFTAAMESIAHLTDTMLHSDGA